jgi:hypothetical protein
MRWQVGNQVLPDSDGSCSGSSSSVRNSKGFVEVKMAYVST